jgi:hypothetical protein
MVNAGSITANAQATDDFSFAVIKREATTKNNDAAYRLADHGIIRSAKSIRTTRKYYLRIRRSAGGRAIKALATLRWREQVCGGKREVGPAKSIFRYWLLQRRSTGCQGLEGLVAKRLDSKYEPGLRYGSLAKDTRQ